MTSIDLDSRSLFDPKRMRVYPRIVVALYVAVAIGIFLWSKSWLDAWGKPLGYDFITFWSASYLTLKGHAADAFNAKDIFLAQRVATPGETIFLWHYPPTFQLLSAPLSLMPYIVSYLAFTAATLAAFVLTTRRLIADSQAVWLLLASPAVYICVLHGQNSLLSAAIFAGAILLMDNKRPVLAGICLGLFAYKPQLGVLLPLALAVSGQWRVFFATAASAIVFAAISTFVLGVDLWFAFFKDGAVVRQIMESGFLPWEKMPSAFIFFRLLGVPQGIAYGLQAVTAIAAAATVAVVWRRFGATRLSFAVLIVATMLVTPYIFDYEFVVLVVALAILANDMTMRGATRFEKIALLIIYIIPIHVAPATEAIHVQIGFLALVASLVLAVRRVYSAGLELVPAKVTPCFSAPNQASNASTMATVPATAASATL